MKPVESEPPWLESYRRAVEAGQDTYRDPATGYFVMTELVLRERGTCCGNGCRHCPFEHAKVDPLRRALLPKPTVLRP
jgi:hypothetical protein